MPTTSPRPNACWTRTVANPVQLRSGLPKAASVRRQVTAVVLAVLVGNAIACDSRAPTAWQSTPSPSPAAQPATRTPDGTGGFHLDADQALNVAATADFLNAYNAGDLPAASAALGPDPVFSDCDYSTQQVVNLHGRAQVASWLKERFDDHSRIVWSEIRTENPTDRDVLGVTVTRVKSDSLAKLGFPDGVAPSLGVKVVFTKDHRIAGFAMGPVGGPPTLCRPRS